MRLFLLCIRKEPRFSLSLFLLTEVKVHARAAGRDQLPLMKGSSFRKFSLRALGFRHTLLLRRQAADLHLCYDRVIMHVVNKHTYVLMCAVTTMSSIQ